MRQVRMLETELPGIAQHHERLDGRGYPSGLTGDALSLTGRIVAVADVFDALTSERPYRKGETAEQAISVLCSEQGTHFDPCCVEALMRARQKGNIHTQKEMEA
jgi:HD-GYP domain-containing protein (c-di-GMP phosphodiesterase class II)